MFFAFVQLSGEGCFHLVLLKATEREQLVAFVKKSKTVAQQQELDVRALRNRFQQAVLNRDFVHAPFKVDSLNCLKETFGTLEARYLTLWGCL